MIYYETRLTENISRREPEGYLLCLNVPVARTGTQEYLPEELAFQAFSPGTEEGPGGDRKAPRTISVFRPESEVFSPETIASFEGMPVTNNHPPDGVTIENIRAFQKGHAHNVRRGTGTESDLLLADLIITDPYLIEAILAGKREISCGYTYELCEENGQYIQRKIRGNHVAVVDAGRAGSRVSIKDEQPSESPIRVTAAMLQPSIVARHSRSEDGKRRSNEQPSESPIRVTAAMLQPSVTTAILQPSLPPQPTCTHERSKPTMKKSLLKKITRMARDGDPEAIEALAEAVEQIVENPSAGPSAETVVIAAETGESPAAAEPSAPEEEAAPPAVTGDSGTIADILDRLDRLIALLTPAPAADSDPGPLPEELAEAIGEAVEAAETAGSSAAENTAEEIAAIIEEVVGETPDPALSAVLEPDEEEAGEDCTRTQETGDAICAALQAVRPVLKRMPRRERVRVCADIAARLKHRGNDSRTYAALAAAGARRPANPADLGRRIMSSRNPNYK